MTVVNAPNSFFLRSYFLLHRKLERLQAADLCQGLRWAQVSQRIVSRPPTLIRERVKATAPSKTMGSASSAISGKSSGPWDKSDWDKVRLVSPPASLLLMRRGCGTRLKSRVLGARCRQL